MRLWSAACAPPSSSLSSRQPLAAAHVATVEALVAAVSEGAASDTVRVVAGAYVLDAPLRPQAGMAILGVGAEATVVTGAASWAPGTADLPDRPTDASSLNHDAYLVDLGWGTWNVTIADLTLRGPQLHGAIVGDDCDVLEVRGVTIEDVLWSGIRTFRMANARVHGNTFVDAGGRYAQTGGALFLTFVADTEIWNNVIRKSPGLERSMYGVKGRKTTRVRVHHNTIRTGFGSPALCVIDAGAPPREKRSGRLTSPSPYGRVRRPVPDPRLSSRRCPGGRVYARSRSSR